MLETVDLNKQMDKATYKALVPVLRERLYAVQKASWDAGVPVIILYEGWDAAGKGTSIQGLTEPIDPRGFKLYPIRAARTYEQNRPWLWRFWQKIPAKGEWAIFDRSWYGRVLVERVLKLIPEKEWRRGYRDIVDFERTIADDGTLIIKFFLHISKPEQKRRFDRLMKDPLTAWHVASEDWDHHRHYDDWYWAYEEMFEHTDTEWGPWTIVPSTCRRYKQVKVFQTIIRSLEERLGISTEYLQEGRLPAQPPVEAEDGEGPDVDENNADEVEQIPLADSEILEEVPAKRAKGHKPRMRKPAAEAEVAAVKDEGG